MEDPAECPDRIRPVEADVSLCEVRVIVETGEPARTSA
eukprot:CAMPEP_0184336902 /NCGR_PEP_ID=MMETSP1089-20130417/5165_1 /TAXON_ID=38269 ORGANISM="Gloeochaete wittrockiana, Strain SAG46.84" /NCGR_SAMPLE_ID=MMETSP1089 /ASSEMBLY_ACC=CAM_ASM_000445 /LENGTH=37 /DNA_ID= /DNA_START= /DNA_END= /DNA_ORIENTATION=